MGCSRFDWNSHSLRCIPGGRRRNNCQRLEDWLLHGQCIRLQRTMLLRRGPLLSFADTGENCAEWQVWSSNYYGAFGVYVGWALLFGILAGYVTVTTKRSLTAAAPGMATSTTD
jgi:hypothetical protein